MSADSSNPAEALRRQLNDWLQPILRDLERASAQQRWEQVEQLCKQALQRDGENWDLWQRLAESHEQRAQWAQAETLWRHLTQRFSSRPEPYLALAELQRRRGAPDAARVVLQEAERRLGESEALRRSLGVIDDPWAVGGAIPELGPEASAQDLSRALQLAQQHLDAGRLSEAEAVLEQILRARPRAGRVQLSLAQLRQRRGETDALIAQLTPLLNDPRSAAELPERQALTLLLVQALISAERWLEADRLLEPLAAAPEQTMDPALLLARAECATGRGDDAAARPWLERCLQLQPAHPRAERLQGELSLRLGDWPTAIAAFSRALAQDPGDPGLSALLEQARREELWWRGEQALRRAAWAEAGEAYRQLLQHTPSHRQALERLDLLASLTPEHVAEAEASGSSGPELRLAQFRMRLDQLEAQLKMLGIVD